jgi:hypothetical protein
MFAALLAQTLLLRVDRLSTCITTVLLNYFLREETTIYQTFSGNSGFFDLNSIWQKAAPEDQRPAPPQNGG